MRNNSYALTKFLVMIPKVVSSTAIKIVISDISVDNAYVKRNWDDIKWKRVNLDKAIPLRPTTAASSVPNWRVKMRRRRR